MDLLGEYPELFVVTENVADEINDSNYPEEINRYEQALNDGHLVQTSLTKEEENKRDGISAGLHIHGEVLKETGIGLGERSIIALALNRNYTSLATDDSQAIKFVQKINKITARHARSRGQLGILHTQDIMVQLIKNNKLDRDEANMICADWADNHRFDLGIASFDELL